uniref:Transcription factor IIIC 90kDa subunit N-terminal domain-containing protein n=1 Tax=Schizaphis graminum TaxID=13262 RepID=A0A2S2NXQ7_SCHGA
MTINLVQEFEYTSKFISCISVDNSFVFSTDDGLLIIDIQSDLFRPSADYKVFRTSIPFSKEKPFEDKNFKEIRFQRPVVCQEHNLAIYPNSRNWNIIYMGNNSNIVFLEKNNNKWIEKLSDIPQKWFFIVSKKPCFLIDKKNLSVFKTENRILSYCREKEKSLQIKNFVFTHTLKHENEIEVYGTICCHLNNMLTFWSTSSEKSCLLTEFEFHSVSIKHIKWFHISHELFWLVVSLTNGQVYVHEILNYPIVNNTFILWPDEDFACVKNIRVESISNDECLIFFTKMSFVLMMLYSLTKKQILSTKKEMIPKTAIIPGFTVVQEKNLLLLVTDVGKIICMYFSTINSEVTYTLKIVNNNFSEQVQNYTCTSVVFSKNECICVLAFQCNIAKYSKNDGHVKNKLLFCTIPENLVELEKNILSVKNYDYDNVIDCIETLRINRMHDKSDKVCQLDRKLLDKLSIQHLKLTYWNVAFKIKKNEYDENILQELQMLLHMRHMISYFSNKKKEFRNEDQYYCRTMLSFYMNKLPIEYVQVNADAANLIHSFIDAKHTYFCNTCERILLSFTDFRMFICEQEHKELRCPVTLGPLGMPSLVCSMCFTMANVNAENQSCVWCFGKYVPNKLLF